METGILEEWNIGKIRRQNLNYEMIEDLNSGKLGKKIEICC
jgi:hypothetical protein